MICTPQIGVRWIYLGVMDRVRLFQPRSDGDSQRSLHDQPRNGKSQSVSQLLFEALPTAMFKVILV